MRTRTDYFFTLKDVYDRCDQTAVHTGPLSVLNSTTTLTELFVSYGYDVTAWTAAQVGFDPSTDVYIKHLLNTSVLVHDDAYVVKSEDSEGLEAKKQFITHLLSFLVQSYPRYAALIGAFEGAKDELMASLTVTRTVSGATHDATSGTSSGTSGGESKTGTSDMPQTASFTASPSTDDVLSSVDQSKTSGTSSSSDSGTADRTVSSTDTKVDPRTTKALRIKEISQSIGDYYKEWSDELFTELSFYPSIDEEDE